MTNFLFINFCNTCGLESIFYVRTTTSSVFLTNSQVSEATDSSRYFVPFLHFLYPQFQCKDGCYVYVNNDITCYRAKNLESSEFSIIWEDLSLSVNISHLIPLRKIPLIFSFQSGAHLDLFSLDEIPIFEYFSVHHHLRMLSSFADQPGEHAFRFASLVTYNNGSPHYTYF